MELPLVRVLRKDQTPTQSVGARKNGWGLPLYRGEGRMETDRQTVKYIEGRGRGKRETKIVTNYL